MNLWYYGFEKSSLFTLDLIFSQFRMDYGRIYWSGIFLNQFKESHLGWKSSKILMRSLYTMCSSSDRVFIFKSANSESSISKNGTSSCHVSCIIEFHTTETRTKHWWIMNFIFLVMVSYVEVRYVYVYINYTFGYFVNRMLSNSDLFMLRHCHSINRHRWIYSVAYISENKIRNQNLTFWLTSRN